MNQILLAFIVALITWYVATAMPIFLRWSFYLVGPLVGGLLSGLLFGNLTYGFHVGSTLPLAFPGAIPVGSTLPLVFALSL